jgi:hypothetical protein
VLGVRALKNDPKGDMGFWQQALENRMRAMGGYSLLETRDVACKGGLKGKQLRFGHDEGTEPHVYVLTLFLTDKTLFLLEAGGARKKVEDKAQAIEWSIANFEPH